MKQELLRIFNEKNYMIFFEYDKNTNKNPYIQALQNDRFFNFPYDSFEVSLSENIGGFTNEEKVFIYEEVKKYFNEN